MIVTKNITKYYGDKLAVNNLNLSVNEGCFYGLLGPNGAGKTTTLKMISMLLNPTDGEIYINGIKATRGSKEVKKLIGVVTQHFSLQRELTVQETLIHHGYLHKMKKKSIVSKMDELIEFAGMQEYRHKTISQLSGGNKRKLMILRSVMHNPKVLFLDEPTVGLDASIRRSIWDLLKHLKSEGLTIILTTHYIEEARQLCDIIGLMNNGKIIKENSPSGFLKSIKPYVVEYFNGDTTEYKYFDTKEQASLYSNKIKDDMYIRRANLEDVYVIYTNERVSNNVAI